MISAYTLGILIIVGSITVASAPPFISRFVDMKTIAFVTAILTGINTLVDPTGKASAFATAIGTIWPTLEKVRYAGPNANVDKLIDVGGEATNALHARTVTLSPITPK